MSGNNKTKKCKSRENEEENKMMKKKKDRY
jgi:hypothetical protein